ncbi:glycosyltransferase family 9 protein [Thiotrichales bacterium 19S3-7]|nr:glycosyltransferase family 9 protein [Thiotrichales bacterium 19S3-7]MCF6802285.1 glycosyltransferase family 9 protein [Thiotrichales bacterium 19S3-11]
MQSIDLKNKKLLVVRADNIGDLVCTTPLIRAIKEQYPTATIDVMLNTYNETVLANNPYVRKIISYEKAKHRKGSLLKTYRNKFLFFRRLKKERYDYALLAAGGFKEKEISYVSLAGIKKLIGYIDKPNQKKHLYFAMEAKDRERQHEVELVYELGKNAFGLTKMPGNMQLYPDKVLIEALRNKYHVHEHAKPIGIHLSSRKPQNRWSIESYVDLIKQLHANNVSQPILIFWSPGSENNPLHPGDDEKAQYLEEQLKTVDGLNLCFIKTEHLSELIAGIALCDSFICCDGGTMHIAAALVNRMVVIFGSTNAANWKPWNVQHHLLQKSSKVAKDVTVSEVIDAFLDLEESIV